MTRATARLSAALIAAAILSALPAHASGLQTPQARDVDANAVVLPDGRRVHWKSDGAWAVRNRSETRLTGADLDLARRLLACKERRHIENGEEALAACREEVGIPPELGPSAGKPSAANASASDPSGNKPPAKKPVKNEWDDPPDDPFGGDGGIIRPGATPASEPEVKEFTVVVCVAQSLVDNDSWNDPPANSKMASFKDLTFRHVVATAKPGWRYLIDAARYRTFDPGQPVEPDVLVSAFSPDSGRFEADGPCWTGFAGYTARVRR